MANRPELRGRMRGIGSEEAIEAERLRLQDAAEVLKRGVTLDQAAVAGPGAIDGMVEQLTELATVAKETGRADLWRRARDRVAQLNAYAIVSMAVKIVHTEKVHASPAILDAAARRLSTALSVRAGQDFDARSAIASHLVLAARELAAQTSWRISARDEQAIGELLARARG